MSHFTVMVVGSKNEWDLQEDLVPFNENTEGLPREWLEFKNKEDEFLKEWNSDKKIVSEFYMKNSLTVSSREIFDKLKNEGKIELRNGDVSHDSCWDSSEDRCKVDFCEMVDGKNVYSELTCKYEVISTFTDDNGREKKEYLITVIEPAKRLSPKEVYSSFEEFVKKYHGHEYRDSNKNVYGYWSNPKAKWDWYTVGGRWKDTLVFNDGSKGDSGLKKDIDFTKDMKEEAEKDWNESLGKDAQARMWMYGVRDGDTKESYINRRSRFSTFAILKDGEWIEKGKMGWWCMVADEKDPDLWQKTFDKVLDSVKDDEMITIVDCHI